MDLGLPDGTYFFVKDNENINKFHIAVFNFLMWEFKNIITLDDVSSLADLAQKETLNEGTHIISYKDRHAEFTIITLP